MAVFAEFFEHQDFGGIREAFTLTNSWRYWWIKFGGALKNEITSLRARAYDGTNGHVYGFTDNDFLGRFASLNMAEDWTCWWSNVGSAMNDDIESALLINRNKSELVIQLADQIAGPFKDGFDAAVRGTQVKRSGDPKVYAVFWPSWDPTRKFVRIEQNLTVEIDWWPDYSARVRYDIYLYLSGGQVHGYVAWTHTWVEGGIFSGDIIDDLHPRLVQGADELTAQLQDQLALLNLLAALAGYQLKQLYLIPGNQPSLPPPTANCGRIGDATENCCLALTY